MTTKDVLLLVLGALLGALTNSAYEAFVGKSSFGLRARLSRRRRLEAETSSLSRSLVRYYRDRGLEHALYRPTTMDSAGPVPLLWSPEATFDGRTTRSGDGIFELDPAPLVKLPVDTKILSRARRRGARIFDGEILSVTGASVDHQGMLKVRVARCNYLSYASLSLALQREVLSSLRDTRLHDEHLTGFSAEKLGSLRPQAVGCSCVTVFDSDEGQFLAIANRSGEVLNAHNVKGVVPNFGLESNIQGRQTSELGLLYFNYVKEYAEEFFDLEEIIQRFASKRSDPDWILTLPPVRKLLEEIDGGRFEISVTGLSISPGDGALSCSLLARSSSPAFFSWLRRELRANWEAAAPGDEGAPIEFVRIDDQLIDEWAVQGRLDPSSIMAIDLARKALNRRDDDQREG